MQKKIVSTIASLTLAAAGVMYAAPSDAGQAHKPNRKATNFAFKGSGYGTKAKGGQVPAGSDTSAFQAFGCTNMAGARHENFVASEQLPGGAEAQEVTTRLATTSAGGETASTSKSHVARVVLAAQGGGSVEITSITSIAKALYDNHGFGSEITSTIGGITAVPPAGDPQTIPVPSPGQSVALPGVGTLTLGTGTKSA